MIKFVKLFKYIIIFGCFACIMMSHKFTTEAFAGVNWRLIHVSPNQLCPIWAYELRCTANPGNECSHPGGVLCLP